MKKISVFILFVAIFVSGFTRTTFAQGNLQFNQVILLDIAVSGTQNITVPAGKIWKIESVGMGSSSSNPTIYLRNASVVNIAFFSSATNSNSASYPYWLPAGFTGSFLNLHPSFRCTVSIIEFNVVP